MKQKILISLIILVSLLFCVNVAQAEEEQTYVVNPNNVIVTSWCSITGSNWQYYGVGPYIFSDGATGHVTFICHLNLVYGPPQYSHDITKFEDCTFNITLAGKLGTEIMQCFGQ